MTTPTGKIDMGELGTRPNKISFTVSINGVTEEIVRIDLDGLITVRGEEVHCGCKVCEALKIWAEETRRRIKWHRQ